MAYQSNCTLHVGEDLIEHTALSYNSTLYTFIWDGTIYPNPNTLPTSPGKVHDKISGGTHTQYDELDVDIY